MGRRIKVIVANFTVSLRKTIAGGICEKMSSKGRGANI
jgi:hypothetical protein